MNWQTTPQPRRPTPAPLRAPSPGADVSIAEVCERLGLSPRTLRYYEELGLLPEVRRRAGGRRVYGEGELQRLRFIQRLKALGLSLAEIGELSALYAIGGSTRAMLGRLDELLAGHLRELDARIAELAGLRDEIGKYRDHIAARVDALGAPAEGEAMTSPQLRLAPAPAADARVRVVTAAALFDGHDAAIHIVRRLLQAAGAEVVHLGHDRSVEEIAEAAVQEDADAVAVSSYQGGHMEFFRYLVQRLRELGAGHVRVYGGGGGTIVPEEIAALEAAGVARIFSPDDGRALGLEGMIRTMLDECAAARREAEVESEAGIAAGDPAALSRAISWFERHAADRPAEAEALRRRLAGLRRTPPAPVVGVTGTGGSGKSSVVDELVRRWRRDHPGGRVGLLLVDPTRRRSGGALLGDRIRMNAIHGAGAFARSLATRAAHLALSATVADGLRVLQAGGFDLLVVETAGIGQSDSEVVDLADVPVYVMTPDYGAPSQLEKIDMLDFAEFVVLNKSDRRGAEDALRDVRKQWRRNHRDFETPDAALPVLATVARAWDDPGMDRLYEALLARLGDPPGRAPRPVRAAAPLASELVPAARSRYLAEIAELVRGYRGCTDTLAERARDAEGCERAARLLPGDDAGPARAALEAARVRAVDALPEPLRRELADWPDTASRYRADVQEYGVRERVHRVENHTTSLAGSRIPKVALPRGDDPGALVRFLRQENLPGRFPFTAGVFPFRLESEDPTRMFAGEGGPARTNRRFHLLSAGQKGVRLSTAFDSVTLYGRDPDERPDIFGKVGTSGVSVCCVDDAKVLYSGFDLCAADTSVSMTINGPAPMVLAFFLNAAIDQAIERHLRAEGELDAVRARFAAEAPLPAYDGELPAGHDGVGLGLLGIRGDRAVDPETYERIRADVLARVRGTVQADILKEDQAQNTCIFSTEFALQLMGDVQAWFVERGVRNFYSVSVSGYHIAEAGANPISQLAFTLANGFTYCEYYLARGMAIDAFAPSFSFFFSNGLDPEYAVIGRVARRIWAIAMRERYGASERSQKLKYHVQTSGRSLHAREMAFNDIRTTLQALLAIQDRCNSLHTNAYDEAVTTPTPESVRRALAIQLIIQRELGTTRNENPLQGSYLIDELTDLVEEAVLAELERISARGGVLGAMETLYQRGRIQEESLLYESKKHSGELPIVGVNTFEGPEAADALRPTALMRASDAEKRAQLAGLRAFQARHAGSSEAALAQLQAVARRGENVFAELMDTVKVASLGQITDALFEVGGRYRRAM